MLQVFIFSFLVGGDNVPGSVSASDIATRKPSRSLVSNSNNTKKGTGSSWLLSQRFCDDPLILSKGPKSLKEPI